MSMQFACCTRVMGNNGGGRWFRKGGGEEGAGSLGQRAVDRAGTSGWLRHGLRGDSAVGCGLERGMTALSGELFVEVGRKGCRC
eukprot:244174-Chlamydomonas_euryale.AAC.2